MQALLAELFPWVAGFVLLDGLLQLRRGHLALVRAGGGFRLLRAGLHLVPPWPAAEVIAGHDQPFLLDGERFLVPDPLRRSEVPVLEPRDLGEVPLASAAAAGREGTRVVAAGTLVAVAPSAAWAGRIGEDLAALAAAPAGEREALRDRQVMGRAAVEEVRRLRELQRPYRFALVALASLVFALVLGVWPLAAFWPREVPVPAVPLLEALGALVLVEAAVAAAMVRRCGDPGGALAAAAHVVLVPVTALRPLAQVERGLFRRFEPWAVAAALLPTREARTLLARERRRVAFSLAASGGLAEAEWRRRDRMLAAVEAGLEPAAGAPVAAQGAAGVCPLCGAAYVAGPTRCSDCHVALDVLPPVRAC